MPGLALVEAPVVPYYELPPEEPPFGSGVRTNVGDSENDPGARRPARPKPPTTVIDRALSWLRDHQNSDGSWGEREQARLTALAVLAFSKEGWSGDSDMYGYTVPRAVQWLQRNGIKHAGRLSMNEKDWEPGATKVHALALQALAEQYILTEDHRFVEVLKQATAYVVGGQAADGGWADQYQAKAGDLTESGWQILALKSVHLTRLKLPGVEAALDRAMKFLTSKRAKDGSYRQGPGDTMRERDRATAAALLGQLIWLEGRNELRDALTYLFDNHGGEGQLDYQGNETDLEAVFFREDTMLFWGGGAWSKWEHQFFDAMEKAQSEDGSWPPMAASGYRNLQSAGDLTGTIYRTAMMALTIPPFSMRWQPTFWRREQ